jgi:hypothetical protein
MLLATLMGMIGLVVLIEAAIVVMRFDTRDPMRRHPP